MRHAVRQRHTEEEEESVFVSMTDMTVSFLFIVMILLAFFATQIAPGETVPKEQLDERDAQIQILLDELQVFRSGDSENVPELLSENARLGRIVEQLELQLASVLNNLEEREVANADLVLKNAELRAELNDLYEMVGRGNKIEEYNAAVSVVRAEILETLRARIVAAHPKIEVSISRDHDALQFEGKGFFRSNRPTPTPVAIQKMRSVSSLLGEVIGCFALGQNSTIGLVCNERIAIIDALQIEGHADNEGTDAYNMKLSAERSASISELMILETPNLLGYENLKGQPVLSVAGYGEGRPIESNESVEGRDANRRIDIRFIMFSPADEQSIPASIDDLERIRDLLRNGEIR